MSTKLEISSNSQIHAGIFSGIEAFYFEGEKWVIANGSVKRFHECDSSIQQPIWKAFMADKQSMAYIAKLGITKASEVFERWYRCVVGGLDSVPDFGIRFTPDAFNNLCTDHKCPHRGLLCSRATGLKNYEVETISELKRGESVERASHRLFISPRGMKSRVEKIKEKMNVPNMAALMVTATQLGI